MSTDAVVVWVNGQLVGADQAVLPALDHGLTVGDGAFETAKLRDGHVVAASRHLARLDRTIAGLGLPPVDHAYLEQGVKAVIEAAGPMPLGRLRYTITGGLGPTGSDRAKGGSADLTYVVTLAPVATIPSSGSVVVVPWVRNERGALAGLKTTSYAENVVALAAAQARGATEAIMANTRDELCEGTGTNVFVVLGGVLCTPPLESGCLAGVTRGLVVQWCREAGVEVREEPLPITAIHDADEVFLTSSIKDVFPIHDVDGRTLAAPGPVTEQVMTVFARTSTERTDP